MAKPSKNSRTVGLYPHNMHPGLVPGIGVDEQRNKYGLDKPLFFITQWPSSRSSRGASSTPMVSLRRLTPLLTGQ